jgi:hypothetical protein
MQDGTGVSPIEDLAKGTLCAPGDDDAGAEA